MNVINCAEQEANQLGASYPKPRPEQTEQTHVHELEGSVKVAEEREGMREVFHDHRFATVSSEAIPCGKSHKHAYYVSTDFFDHHHEIGGETGPAIYVCEGKHVHFAEGKTTYNDGHVHDYQFATIIDSPQVFEKKKDHC